MSFFLSIKSIQQIDCRGSSFTQRNICSKDLQFKEISVAWIFNFNKWVWCKKKLKFICAGIPVARWFNRNKSVSSQRLITVIDCEAISSGE